MANSHDFKCYSTNFDVGSVNWPCPRSKVAFLRPLLLLFTNDVQYHYKPDPDIHIISIFFVLKTHGENLRPTDKG
jgi:hypothetical protein